MSSIARTAATGGALDPEFLAWQTSLPVDRRLLEVDVAGSVAHVEGLVAGGLLSREEGDTLQAALRSLPGKVARGEVELPLEEDVHMAVEVWLRATVGELADKLHTGRSRNDQVATDLQLWIRAAIGRLLEALELLDARLDHWIAAHGEIAMPAYTHRQVAIPVLARLWIGAALREPLARDRRLLAVVEDEIADSPLGAGAIGGNTLPIDPWVAARELGFAGPPRNPLDAVGSRDHALTLAFACARIGQHLARFCADVVELASDGLVTLGGAVACGSSMMPHKRKPDLFELVRGQAALRQGELVALLTTFHGLGTGYHRDFQQDKQVIFASVDGTVDCLKMIALGVDHLELLADRCKLALEHGDAIATDLTEHLVAHGTPFRVAYRQIGALVASQRAQGKRLVELSGEDLDAAGLPRSLLEQLDVIASAGKRAARYPG
ncbi:MAG TPA: argininosuccinate lyase [Enhygromyxa sp.]|nr:argininosuccinate lyase [Enhygromyxa sp.]